MKLLISTVFAILVSTICIGQRKQKDIQTSYKLDSNAIEKIISFLDIDYQKYSISERFKDSYCNIIIEEYKKGKIVETKNLRNDVKKYEQVIFIGDNLRDSMFNVEIMSRKTSDSLLKLQMIVGGLGYNAKLKLFDTLHYSWKELTNINKRDFSITGTSLPLLTYTSPIGEKFTNHPGNFEFCRINNELIPFQDWYTKLGIEHFFIFTLRFEKP